MADTTGGDTDIWTLLVPALLALIAGLAIHSFIIGVNVSDWWRGRSVTPVDLIVTSLAICRIGAQCVITMDLVDCTFLMSKLDSVNLFVMRPIRKILDLSVTLLILDAIYTFFCSANIWLTSLLSIVLYVKISNLHTRLFLYLRRMILPRTGRLIVASLLLSALNSLISQCMYKNVTTWGTYNITKSPIYKYGNDLLFFFMGTFFPLIFNSISSVLLFVSLYHHTTRMKMSSNLSINLETYYSAMRFVSFTFLYKIMFFFCHYFGLFYYHFYSGILTWLCIFLGFLPTLHSSYLIYTTVNLRSQMSKVLQNFLLDLPDSV
ncbi:hypothetical protein GDO81_025064 [Engystomops pustulosus]|uniref:Taste receptor type 2 n=1 Tax=Engystomops pustulosus TaxID=76066 RepID=A0AAV6ZMJ3_ENGPU|nr:hypothetical protein GDO81_025064 [Engystomops pustulosus]